MTRNLIALAGLAAVATAANAQVGVAVSGSGADNFVSETITVDIAYDGNAMTNGTWSGGDMFGITSRSTIGTTGMPFSIADDSLFGFSGDNLGIIDETDQDRFFGVTDTFNGANPSNGGNAVWQFNGGSNLEVSIDMAAMGDFEGSGNTDIFDFTYSYDGVNFFPLFTSSVDEAGAQDYTMAGGLTYNLSDPMDMNGTRLINTFQTLTASAPGSGSSFYVAFYGQTDGSEGFAFRNMIVNVPTPGTAAVLGLAGLAGIRRRR